MDFHGNWSYPTDVRIGVGRIAELPDADAISQHPSPARCE